MPKNKKPSILTVKRVRTQGRGRTGTIVKSLVFETNASTNSATWAFGIGQANVYNSCSNDKFILALIEYFQNIIPEHKNH